jgi:hypothetical protein
MIWSEQGVSGNTREALSLHLASEIAAAYDDAVPEHAAEIAHAVAAYCIQHKDSFSVSSEYMAFLISRALRAVGEHHAAKALCGGRPSHAVETAAQFREVPPALWNVFASKLVRPSRWLVDDGKVIWVLDLSRFRFDADLGLELAFHPAIRSILYAVAEIWDQTAGAGILGLRGVAKCGRPLSDVQTLCRDLLERIKAERAWVSAPRILSLDVAR